MNVGGKHVPVSLRESAMVLEKLVGKDVHVWLTLEGVEGIHPVKSDHAQHREQLHCPRRAAIQHDISPHLVRSRHLVRFRLRIKNQK